MARINSDFNRYSPEQLIEFALSARNEAAITALFSLYTRAESYSEDRLPIHPKLDCICYEFAVKYGRADIVVFHSDNSATVIEVKNGDVGPMWVMSGLGQVAMYAMQIALSQKGALKRVRKALLWTSTGDLLADAIIETACEEAGVIALPWGKLAAHLAVLVQPAAVLQGAEA